MYCKQCGHRSAERADNCPQCGVKLVTTIARGPAPKASLRWQVPAAAVILGVIVFVVFPRVFLRTELEPAGPTSKLRFLRALDRSEYRRAGQRGFRVEDQTLIVIWDLRWNTLPESRQQDIVRIVGRAWRAVGGGDTHFRVEGEDDNVASYTNGEVSLGLSHP